MSGEGQHEFPLRHPDAPPDGHRDGETYHAGIDFAPLNKQQQRVYLAVRDGDWFTLRELSSKTGDPEASVSARLRDLRKDKFGGHTVNRRRRHGGRTWEYKLEKGDN